MGNRQIEIDNSHRQWTIGKSTDGKSGNRQLGVDYQFSITHQPIADCPITNCDYRLPLPIVDFDSRLSDVFAIARLPILDCRCS